MEVMAQLLREDRAPSDLMATYADADAKRARNGPCTCGSERIWKRCHGAPQTLQRARSA